MTTDDDMRMTEIGARLVEADGGRTVFLVPRERITIEELEARARPFLATDPEPFRPASAFVFETQYRRMRDGTRSPVKVKVHPDPRVQAVLYQMREGEAMKAIAEMRQTTEHLSINAVDDVPWSVQAGMNPVAAAIYSDAMKARDQRRAKAKAARQARKRKP
jgi:hypothetical protein